jgi:hypothetical protein
MKLGVALPLSDIGREVEPYRCGFGFSLTAARFGALANPASGAILLQF